MEQEERLLLVTKHVYPDVAKAFGTNWKAVERNIRTISGIAWERSPSFLEELARRPLTRSLTTAEFLSVLSYAALSIGSRSHMPLTITDSNDPPV